MKLLLPLICGLLAPRFLPGAPSAVETLRDFDLRVVASGPGILNPVAIDWDASGRMWVAVTPDNPLKPRSSWGRDRILILEDSIGNRPRTFASGLTQVSTFVFHRDGIIAAEGSRIVWLRDTNRDGTAESREVLFSGFGSRLEPALLTSFRRG